MPSSSPFSFSTHLCAWLSFLGPMNWKKGLWRFMSINYITRCWFDVLKEWKKIGLQMLITAIFLKNTFDLGFLLPVFSNGFSVTWPQEKQRNSLLLAVALVLRLLKPTTALTLLWTWRLVHYIKLIPPNRLGGQNLMVLFAWKYKMVELTQLWLCCCLKSCKFWCHWGQCTFPLTVCAWRKRRD